MSVTVEIPKEVYEILEDEARRRGCGVLDIIISTVIEKLDPMVRVEIYLRLHEKYLKEAEELYVKGNLLQASEKYWGAVTALLNAIGEVEGLPHYSHKELKEISIYLSEREGDPEYTRLFSSVETLHANFYHNFLKKKTFDVHREDAIRLIEKLKTLIARSR